MILKNYSLSTIGNKKIPSLLLICINFATSIIVYFSTFSFFLSITNYRSFDKVNLKQSLRGFNWFLQFGFLRKLRINDLTFNPAYFINTIYRDKLIKKIKLTKQIDPVLYFDILYLYAEEIEESLLNSRKDTFIKLIKKFSNEYNRVIRHLDDRHFHQKNLNSKHLGHENSYLLLTEALLDFSEISNKYKLTLVFGTLLGFIREGGILNHDIDIDVSYQYQNKSEFFTFIHSLKSLEKFKIIYNGTATEYGLKKNQLLYKVFPSIITVAHKNGAHIDIFIRYNKGKNVFFYAKHFCWKNSFFEDKEKLFDGLKFNIPVNSDKYLFENYGDWKLKNINYNFIKDSKNLTFSKNLPSIVSFTKSLFLNSNSKKEFLDLLEKNKLTSLGSFNLGIFIHE